MGRLGGWQGRWLVVVHGGCGTGRFGSRGDGSGRLEEGVAETGLDPSVLGGGGHDGWKVRWWSGREWCVGRLQSRQAGTAPGRKRAEVRLL